MSIIRTADRSLMDEINGWKFRPSGLAQRAFTAPVYVGAGSSRGNLGATTLDWATASNDNQVVKGDFGVAVVETSGADSTVTMSGTSTWAHFPGSPVTDVADATGSKLNVLWSIAPTDSPSFPTVNDPGDHWVGRIFSFRGVSWQRIFNTATAADTTATTSLTYPAVTTTSPNNAILCIATRPNDTNNAIDFSAFANANLTGVTEAGEAGNTAGNGGGFVLNYGFKATAGSTGTSTGTCAVNVTHAYMTIALEPNIGLPRLD